MEDTRKLMAAVASPSTNNKTRHTVVHEIMNSKLPSSEKTVERVFEDVSTVTGAGFETTASVLRLIFFHIFSNVEILQQLRAELSNAGAPAYSQVDLKVLERLPYLTAILMEGLRLSPAIATRMARISPHSDLIYKNWRIPAGTPVGMTLILMHTDKAFYVDPMRFNPDRWMNVDSRKAAEKAFAPFSKGTRNCLGMQ
jgi:cytochrome P450